MKSKLFYTLKIIVFILAIVIFIVGLGQQHHLDKDQWTCTETHILYEIDADGNARNLSKCIKYQHIKYYQPTKEQ